MRGWSLFVALSALAGCGRFGFDASAHGDAAPDAGEPGGITVIADWSALNPYDSTEFPDGTDVDDNRPAAVASLRAPFREGFVVSVGRRLIELPTGGQPVIHDYRPAMANAAGPDEIVELATGAVPGFSGLYAGASSLTNGDGVYLIDAAWQISRDQATNNVSGIAADESGAFDGIGTPVTYFTGGSKGVYRRDSQATTTLIVNYANDVGDLAVDATQMYVVDSDGDPFPSRLWRIAPGTHAKTQLDTAMGIVIAEGDIPASGLVAVRERHDVVRYSVGGTFDVLASAPDASSLWIGATIPRAPHALAGRIVVLEWNTDTDTQRLLLLPP